MTNKIEFATSRKINSVWTLVFRRVEGGVEILANSRDIEAGYELEHQLPDYRLTEGPGRIVYEVLLGERHPVSYTLKEGYETLKVVNPKMVFSYDPDNEWIDKYPSEEA